MALPQLYVDAADICASAVDRLALHVPAPRLLTVSGHKAYRYLEKTQQQAIVLKCAAAASRLRASFVLWEAGFLQEQGALHRMLDETNEDVWFLSLGLINGEHTAQHAKYLTAFFAEEFGDASDVAGSYFRRDLVPRKKIRAYIAAAGGVPDPHRDTVLAEALSGVYSGFVHGAAQHILMCYGGDPPHFALNGLCGTSLMAEHLYDAWNYVFRTLQGHHVAAAALKDDELFVRLDGYIQQFQHRSGRSS